ncbi:MAG: thioredoxin [Candidatus Neomarinimicrobiota bacterium]|nr:thioredoxin [Candidatus Neomarinimicrobiota bacterium]MEC7854604.1 thioredoxin [Candidatus Neomarinimicrobiota bacterium]MEC7981632.1 thioredoxin [Candidatus Neomarinimicrobiota bacterium]MEC8689534.1 thioredoxin [Candidatus Neomarinimicrobiota bacterium]|tara:strand:- start:3088 stop:3414 length:327 start_codon:yes stop_codon:yes gene_type:complete
MSDNVKELTSNDFKTEVLESDSPVLVDFWAEWCGPCKVIAPVIEELALDYDGKVKFGKLNVDDHNQVASEYGVRSIPTLLVFKNGAVVNQIVGAVPKERIAESLDTVI